MALMSAGGPQQVRAGGADEYARQLQYEYKAVSLVPMLKFKSVSRVFIIDTLEKHQ